jgi:hypothetical protein
MPTFLQLWGDDLSNELGTNDTSVLFTDARRKHAINVGIRHFAELTECFVKRSTVTVSSSAQEFNLNSTSILSGGDFVRLAAEGPAYYVSDSNGTQRITAGAEEFPQVSIPQMDARSGEWRSTETPGDPSGWYTRKNGGAFYFGLDRPANVGSSEAAEILVPYVARPSSCTSDTQVPFAVSTNYARELEEYHQAAVHYGAHLMEKLRRDDERASNQLNAFMGYVNRYNAQTRPKGPRQVRMNRAYFRVSRYDSDDAAMQRAPWWR